MIFLKKKLNCLTIILSARFYFDIIYQSVMVSLYRKKTIEQEF